MIDIVIDQASPRVEYVCELLFGRILGLSWQTRLKSESPGKGFAIHYSPQNPKEHFHIPCNGWLYESGLRELKPSLEKGAIARLFPDRSSHAYIPFDLFAATFYLATEYFRYFDPPLDKHGRPTQEDNPGYQHELYATPLIHFYADLLKSQLQELQPGLQFGENEFDYQITVDVDQPWRFLHRRLPISLGGMARDFSQGRFAEIFGRIRAMATGQDPYDLYDYLEGILPLEKTIFFFLIARHSPFDNRFALPHPAYEGLIRKVRAKGYAIGIHPSYLSSENSDLIPEEIRELESISGPVDSSRQHFLRYRLPEKFRKLLESGIRHEYSLTPLHCSGFAGGMAVPYPWFDVEANRVTGLMLHPGMVMDRSLQMYKGLDPTDAEKEIIRIASLTRRVNGKFVLNLHNETFSDLGEWKGWKKMLERVIKGLEALRQHEGSFSGKP